MLIPGPANRYQVQHAEWLRNSFHAPTGRNLIDPALTVELAQQIGKPHWIIALKDETNQAAFRAWLDANQINTLNVAGPRESKRPGIYDAAYRCLESLLRFR